MPPKKKATQPYEEPKPFPIPDKLPNDPAKILELLSQIPNMRGQDKMEMDRRMDIEQKCAPFPSKRAKKLIARINTATQLREVLEDDMWTLFGLAGEDYYMESAREVGAPEAFLHVLQLCHNFAQARMEANSSTKIAARYIIARRLAIFGIAEGLLNQNNKRATVLDPIIDAIIPIILQDTPIREGFPADVTTMNFAIKALAETITAYGTQFNTDPITRLVVHNPDLLIVIRTYIRNEQIECPLPGIQTFIQASSLLCTTRFVMSLGMTLPRIGIYHMREYGFLDAMEAVSKSGIRHYDALSMVRESIKILNFLPPDKSVTMSVCPHTKAQVRRLCDNCAVAEQPADPLKVCASCKQRRYCSRDCQVAHWKSIHSSECKQLKLNQPNKYVPL